ncbi:MAG: hypothetical protein B6245_13990 [Desulfobacteraceae bacterium 4572_88]|nr:MAG: hypothetical protein B6245_13990 [Desulfobacteraceae bacterium 4572_88]
MVTSGSWLGGESYGTGKGGDIFLEASESARISDYALIATSAKESSIGQAGNITITTPALNIETGAVIESRSEGPGTGGDIAIHAGTLEVTDGGKISAQALRSGSGGNLTVSGPDVATHDDFANSVRISGTNTEMSASTSGTGDAGTISIMTQELSLTDNAVITTSASDTGDAGSISLKVGTLNLSSGASVTSASQYPDTRVHTVANPSELEQLSGIAQKGDVVIVQDAGNGEPAAAILDDGNYWVILTGDVFTVDELSELNEMIDYGNPADGEGTVVVVRNAGAGEPASFVYNGWMAWLELSKVYTVPDAELRNSFAVFPADVMRIEETGGTSHLTYTGREWIPCKTIHAIADLSERDRLTPSAGDVAKVENVGNDVGKSFIFDGTKWISFYMTGQAGTIAIHADDTVSLKEAATLSTSSTGGVHAGEILLEADTLQVDTRAIVSSTSESIGDSGTISIRVGNTATLSDNAALITATMGAGSAGDISLDAAKLELRDHASVSSESSAASHGGDAGTIVVNARESVRLSGESELTTQAVSAGGGKIFVNAGDLIYLLGSDITSSVKFGEGKGGDVTMNSMCHPRTAASRPRPGGAMRAR